MFKGRGMIHSIDIRLWVSVIRSWKMGSARAGFKTGLRLPGVCERNRVGTVD